MIKATGFGAERFMNMLSYRGAYLWDVETEGVGVRMKVPLSELPLLETCAEKTGCGLQILGYGGLPAKVRRFQGRQVLLAGLLLFAAGMYLLSSFIWVIRVEGNVRLQEVDILAYCKEIGLGPGSFKRSVDTEHVTKSLLGEFSDISWVSVGVQGTDVTIKLAETIQKAEMVDKETPCDVVANADGVILKITAERGTPLVKDGDVVEKGDILISSAVTIGLEGEEQRREYVAAEGMVTARIWKDFTDELPLAYEEKKYTGEEKENRSLLFFGRELDVIRPTLETEADREVLSERELALGDFTLPIAIKKESYRPYVMEEKSRTAEEARTELAEILRKKTEQFISSYGTIVNIEIQYEEYTDLVRAKAEAVLTERIDEKKDTEEGRDAIDGTNRENIATGQ